MYVCMYVCVYAGMYVCAYLCMYDYYEHMYLYILYVLYIWGILLCYGGEGGTLVSVYNFVFYVLLFDDLLQ